MMYVSYPLSLSNEQKIDFNPVDADVLGRPLLWRALCRATQTNESTSRENSHTLRPSRRGRSESLPPHRVLGMGSARCRKL